ncbi:hypothetical protein HDU96_003703 [Phlyctochytrium bullatum]|nr:hypothetical protein HDU96_003703 [Phlyctochytrium bullatum]
MNALVKIKGDDRVMEVVDPGSSSRMGLPVRHSGEFPFFNIEIQPKVAADRKPEVPDFKAGSSGNVRKGARPVHYVETVPPVPAIPTAGRNASSEKKAPSTNSEKAPSKPKNPKIAPAAKNVRGRQTFLVEPTHAPEKRGPSIPKKIWTYWSNNNPPRFIRDVIYGWRRFNPQYEITLITPETMSKYIRIPPPPNFERSSLEHKTNWISLAILNEYGGFWLDTSVVLTGSLASLKEQQEASGKDSIQFFSERETMSETGLVAESWFIGTAPMGRYISSLFLEFNMATANFKDTAAYLDYIRQVRGEAAYNKINQFRGSDVDEVFTAHMFSKKVIGLDGVPPPLFFDAASGPYRNLLESRGDMRKQGHLLRNKIVGPQYVIVSLTSDGQKALMEQIENGEGFDPKSFYAKYIYKSEELTGANYSVRGLERVRLHRRGGSKPNGENKPVKSKSTPSSRPEPRPKGDPKQRTKEAQTKTKSPRTDKGSKPTDAMELWHKSHKHKSGESRAPRSHEQTPKPEKTRAPKSHSKKRRSGAETPSDDPSSTPTEAANQVESAKKGKGRKGLQRRQKGVSRPKKNKNPIHRRSEKDGASEGGDSAVDLTETEPSDSVKKISDNKVLEGKGPRRQPKGTHAPHDNSSEAAMVAIRRRNRDIELAEAEMEEEEENVEVERRDEDDQESVEVFERDDDEIVEVARRDEDDQENIEIERREEDDQENIEMERRDEDDQVEIERRDDEDCGGDEVESEEEQEEEVE